MKKTPYERKIKEFEEYNYFLKTKRKLEYRLYYLIFILVVVILTFIANF